MHKNIFNISAIAIIFIAVCCVYANSLGNNFVWDDEFLIIKNSYIHSWDNIIRLFASHLFEASGKLSISYRPLQSFTYMLDYSIWGLKATGYHISNIILHGLCAIMLYISVNLITKDRCAAFCSALIFGVHPINTEAVTYISGRADPLMGIFLLGGLSLFALFRRSKATSGRGYLIAFIPVFILTILSKEYGIFLALLLLLYDAYYKPVGPMGKKISPYLIIIAVLMAYAYIRSHLIAFPSEELSLSSGVVPPLGYRVLTFFKILVLYMGLLVLPVNLYMDRGLPFSKSLLDIYVIGSLVIIFLLLYVTLKSYRRQRDFSFYMAWFFVMILPLSDTFYPLNASMAEHWLYIPSMGFITAGVIFITKWMGIGKNLSLGQFFRRFAVSPFIILLIFFSARTIIRNRDWKDDFTLLTQTAAYADSSAVHGNLAVAYYEKGDIERAIAECKHAIALQPNFPEAHYNLGHMYMEKAMFKDAAFEFEQAIRYRPAYKAAYTCLLKVYKITGEAKKAQELLRQFQKIK